MQWASSTKLAFNAFLFEKLTSKLLNSPSNDSGLAKTTSHLPLNMSSNVICFGYYILQIHSPDTLFCWFWRLQKSMIKFCIRATKGDTTITVDNCMSFWLKNLNTKGAISNVKLFPLPVGEKNRTSFPLKYRVTTSFWFGLISIYPNTRNALPMASSIMSKLPWNKTNLK